MGQKHTCLLEWNSSSWGMTLSCNSGREKATIDVPLPSEVGTSAWTSSCQLREDLEGVDGPEDDWLARGIDEVRTRDGDSDTKGFLTSLITD